MFDLKRSVDEWRQQLRRNGELNDGDINELEDHLREEMQSLEKLEISQAEVFFLATRRIGQIDPLKKEFEKNNLPSVWLGRLYWIAIGILACFLGMISGIASGQGVGIGVGSGEIMILILSLPALMVLRGRHRRWFVTAIILFALAVLLTPPDPASATIVGVPLIIAFAVGVFGSLHLRTLGVSAK